MNKPPKNPMTGKENRIGIDSETLGQLRESGWRMTDEHYVALGRILSIKAERVSFPFSGIDEAAYRTLKIEEPNAPPFITPVDELLARFQASGMKVVRSGTPGNREVFILPADSNDITADSLFPRHLKIAEGMDAQLKELIYANGGGR